MVSSLFISQASKALDIEDTEDYHSLYLFWQTVDKDLNVAGLGIPSTFADHLSRINSSNQAVVLSEKKWFEDLVKSTYSLTKNQFSPTHQLPDQVYPTYFMLGGSIAIPRMLPQDNIVLPGFSIPKAGFKFGYTKQQLAIAVRHISAVNPYDTFHDIPVDSDEKRQHQCIGKLYGDRPAWTVSDLCPDLVSGIICSDCNAEGLVTSNLVLARSGYKGVSTIDTIPPIILKRLAASTLKSPCKVPFEQLLWFFAASTYADHESVNGTEVQAYKILRSRYEDNENSKLKGWSPSVLTKAAYKAEQDRLTAMAEQTATRRGT